MTGGAVVKNGEVVECVWDVMDEASGLYGCLDLWCDGRLTYDLCEKGKCWWNGDADGSGVCLSLSDDYTCSILSPSLCNIDGDIMGILKITDSPCFVNDMMNADGMNGVCTVKTG
jgi:hypothetical protein